MTAKDRVLAALRHQPVDRVPILEMAIDWKVMRGLGYRSYLRMIEGLDLDAISVNQVLYLLGWRRWIVPHMKYYTDEWGVRSRLAGELLPVPVGHPITTGEDLARYRPPRPEHSPLLRAIRYVKRRAGDRAVIMLSRNDFAASWFLCGMERLLTSYIEEPEFAEALAELVCTYYERLFALAVGAGVDVVFLTDDYAYKTGTLMDRSHFDRFIRPYLTRGVDAIHRAGGLCVKHTDGDISGIIDAIVDAGFDGIGPLEPAAGMDLVSLQERWGDRVAFVGNVDVDLLSRGAPEEVAAVTHRLVTAMVPRGGHLLSSGNTISSSVRPESYRAMIEAGRRVGVGR